MNTNDYGFESTNDIEFDKLGLPVGIYKAMVVGEEFIEKGVVAEYEALTGDNKGKRGKTWYLTKHENPQTANIAKQNIKRFAEATGRPVSSEAPMKGRVLTLEVRTQKKNPDYTEIFRYWPENHQVVDDSPPL